MTPIRVALAEDEPSLRDALTDLIAVADDLVLAGTAADGQAAVDLVEREQPDVLLLDVKMPRGDGEFVVSRLRGRGARTKVLALSAYEDRPMVLTMLRSGAVGYLVKGCGADEVLRGIRGAADGAGALSPSVSREVVQELASRLQYDEMVTARRRQITERVRATVGGGIVPVFQPIVDLVSGRPRGVEALSRFDDPQTSPQQWFDEAHEVGLGPDLELAAIRAVAAVADRIPGGWSIWLNVGPDALHSPSLLDALAGVGLARCVFELTEHARVSDYQALARTLEPLRAGGARLAVDDAGAGFASLRHILRLSPDFIKIDRAIVDQLDDDRGARALAAALTSFAAEMGAEVVAEGVERNATATTLTELGVHLAQGYLFARPVAPDALDAVLHEARTVAAL
jgi:EAL domain-containing protein (putative c-di-GMP-specific phosphodiesterase class I)